MTPANLGSTGHPRQAVMDRAGTFPHWRRRWVGAQCSVASPSARSVSVPAHSPGANYLRSGACWVPRLFQCGRGGKIRHNQHSERKAGGSIQCSDHTWAASPSSVPNNKSITLPSHHRITTTSVESRCFGLVTFETLAKQLFLHPAFASLT